MKTEPRTRTDLWHLFGLCGFAVAQPLYDLLGRNSTFFVIHRASPLDLLSFVLIVSLGLPVALALFELAVARLFGEPARRGVHGWLVFGLISVVALAPIGRALGTRSAMILTIAGGMGLLLSRLYISWPPARTFVTMLSFAAVVFPLYFLGVTPVGRLLFSQSQATNPTTGIGNPVPVVMIVFDEFNSTALLDESGEIDAVRFPNFAALGARSWWFPNAVASHPGTVHAVPALLTGNKPRLELELNPTVSDFPQNLFTLLGESYKFNISEPLTMLCPEDLCRASPGRTTASKELSFWGDLSIVYLHLITPPSLALDLLPSLDAQWAGFSAPSPEGVAPSPEDAASPPGDGSPPGAGSADKAEADVDRRPKGGVERSRQLSLFLSGIEAGTREQLHFLHVFLPHVPYEFLSTGHVYQPTVNYPFPEGIEQEATGFSDKTSLIKVSYYQYLQQVGFVDGFLGQLMERLEQAGLAEEALIIVTADHGLAFRPGMSRRNVNSDTARDVLKIPLFVKQPGQKAGHVDDRLVSGIDVLPTIMDVLEVDQPWPVDGRSLFAEGNSPRTEVEIPGVGRFAYEEIAGFPLLEWQQSHFGSGTPLDQLTVKESHSELVGRELYELQTTNESDFQIRSDVTGWFEQVDPASGFLPALVRGEIEGAGTQELPLAVALNGRIWATAKTVEWRHSLQYFSTMLPPAAFRQGSNQLQVWLIEETAQGLELSEIPFDGAQGQVSLERVSAHEKVIRFGDDRAITCDATWEMVQGGVDRIQRRSDTLLVGGWAADFQEYRPAQFVLFFSGERLVHKAVPQNPRADVVEAHGQQSLLQSGFTAVLPLDSLPSQVELLQIFFVSWDDRAFEVNLRDAHKEKIRVAIDQRQGGRSSLNATRELRAGDED